MYSWHARLAQVSRYGHETVIFLPKSFFSLSWINDNHILCRKLVLMLSSHMTIACSEFSSTSSSLSLHLLMKDHRHPKARDKFDIILLPIYCMHTSMPSKRTSRRLRGYPPESQERVEIGSTDEEALPPHQCSHACGGHVNLYLCMWGTC